MSETSFFDKVSGSISGNEDAAQFAVEEARRLGADECEAAVAQTRGLEVTTRDADTENIEFSKERGLVITVWKNHRRGTSATTDLSRSCVAECVRAACELAADTDPDPCSGLCDRELLCTQFADFDLLYPIEEDPDVAVKKAAQLENLAFRLKTSEVRNSDGAYFSSAVRTSTLVTSHGFMHSHALSSFSCGLTLIGERDGAMQRGYGFSTGRRYADLYAPEKVVQEAIRHTVEKLGARQVKTERYPVILTDSAARSLIGHFKEAIMGYNIYLRTSFLMDKLGCQVMPAFLQLQEDPHVTGCLGSSSYDGEGVRTYAQDIVKDGRLQEYFLGSYSARKLGLTSNAHAGVSFCQYVRADQEHTKTPEEMMQQAGEGLIIDSLIGQGVDVTSGNYSRGASGFYFKDGVKQFPVENITLAGNLKDMLLNIACVGSDIDERYRLKCGSLLLPDLAVSGE